MKVEARELRTAIAWACQAIPQRTTQPLLTAAVIEATNGELFVSGFNGDTHATAVIDCAGDNLPKTLVPGQVLRAMAEQLDATVQIELNGRGTMTLTAGRAHYALRTMAPDYYPTTPTMPEIVGRIAAVDLQELTSRVAVAATPPNGPSPIFVVMTLEAKGGQIRATATDRYRLHRTQWEWRGDDFQALVPARELADLAKSLSGVVTVMLAEESGVIGFADDHRQVTIRLLAADAPKVDVLLGDNDDAPIVVMSQDALVAAVRGALVAAGKGGLVRLTPMETVATVSGLDNELGEGEVEVNADCSGPTHPAIFNATYLTDAIAALPGTHVRMQLPTRPDGVGKVKLQGLPAADGEPIPAVTTVVMAVAPTKRETP